MHHLPIGIQNFEKIRNGHFLYIDKTESVFRLAHSVEYAFLSRPRRFGKSLLTSTLESYFSGRKDLFKGLAIERLEKTWTKHPVLHIDLNGAEYSSVEALTEKLEFVLSDFEHQYAIQNNQSGLGIRFERLIKEIFRQANERVVVLIDEYDKPLLEAIDAPQLQEHFRFILQSFYSTLKSCDAYLRFVFLTGVTRFGKLSVFSGLNNLRDISLSDEYSDICGFTESEIQTELQAEVQSLAKKNDMTQEQAMAEIRLRYDGYHFSRHSQGVYNPFSLLNCLSDNEFRNYWFSTGTPIYLVRLLKHDLYDLSLLKENVVSTADRLADIGSAANGNVVSVLYQSGYLTLKDYDVDSRLYHLGFPNKEVEEGFLNSLLPYYSGISEAKIDSVLLDMKRVLDRGQADDMMRLLKTVFASVPFESDRNIELNYRNIVYLVFTLLGARPLIEVPVSSGRIDMLIERPRYTYIFEFKLGKSAGHALNQIQTKHYADAFTRNNPVILVGVNFDDTIKNIVDWVIKKDFYE